MSWSFHAKGKPEEVLTQAKDCFPGAKSCVASIPAELKMVEAAEQQVQAAVEHAQAHGAEYVTVEAYGSAYLKGPWGNGGIGCTVKIEVTPEAPKQS